MNFPRGKLNQDDEGQIPIKIGVQDRTIVVDFGKPVHWFGFSAADARALAALLIKHADAIEKGPIQ